MNRFPLVYALALSASLLGTCAPANAVDLVDAVRADNLQAARAALSRGADPDQLSNLLTLPTIAAIRGNGDMLELLLEAGADPDASSLAHGVSTLSAAVRSCKAGTGIVRTLIDAKADLESRSGDGLTPVMLAIQEERVDIALMLLDAGADVNALNPWGEGLLNYAIYVKSPVLIQAVLDRGVDISPLNKLFTTVDYDPPGIGLAVSHHSVTCR